MIDTTELKDRLNGWRSSDCAGAVAVRVNGVVVWHDVLESSRIPIERDRTRLQFPIYSITKTVTALCMLRLQMAGRLHVDDPVRHWLPDLRLPESIRLSHLLRHTSGLSDYGSLPEYHSAVRDSPASPWTALQFLDVALQRGLLFEPGMGWSYSNIGYMLLRQVLES